MKQLPIEVFSQWVTNGKDEGMEKNHALAVADMLAYATKDLNNYQCIDAGCGNGWVVRQLAQQPSCQTAIGVDGSAQMIEKAQRMHTSGTYVCADLMSWSPQEAVDLVHSMEVFYYMEDPKKLIAQIYQQWLKPKGRLIVGVDFYTENTTSHTWPEDCGISIMHLFSEKEWVSFFKSSGFKEVHSWRIGAQADWAGTLAITGVR